MRGTRSDRSGGGQTDADPEHGLTFSKATLADVPPMKALVDPYADRDLMLPRSTAELFENIRDYSACRDGARIVGCVALHIFSADVAEIRALAVDSKYMGRGIGGRLVEECVADKHEIPHFANLCDLMLKYADVESFDTVSQWLSDNRA